MKDYTQVMGYEIYREVLKVALFQVEERTPTNITCELSSLRGPRELGKQARVCTALLKIHHILRPASTLVPSLQRRKC